ncbi:hypothetical protein F5Y17DRAFT_415632 [Xylariaceae sp. FL0594]|nr:hypothetical protein F5Y17DRAFT_415632 [Xylariaceae sp. FL0594]
MADSRESTFNIPVGGSWRMVEGANDSFDTSYMHETFEDPLSSGPSQDASFSQETESQHSIRDFADRADEDQVILRAPFQPSIASTRHTSMNRDSASVPEFFMPRMDSSTDSGTRRSNRVSGSARTSVTATPSRPVLNDAAQLLRMRKLRQEYSDDPRQQKRSSPRPAPSRTKALESDGSGLPRQQPDFWQRITSSAPHLFLDCLSWTLTVLGMALRLVKWPIAVFLALYLAFAVLIVGKNMITQSVTTSLQPVCRMPGASLLKLPFCSHTTSTQESPHPVEFDGLMKVQYQFEKVLEDSAEGVSLPMEMLRSEASLRDLRTLVKFSELPARDEMVFEFDGYITAIHETSRDLQTFNTHVGGAVDSVININRWTSRYIDSMITKQEQRRASLLSRGMDWLFSPFQPTVFEERFILDKYIEHTAFVSDKIVDLIVEAQAILRLLAVAEDHLQVINEHVVRSGQVVQQRHSDIFYTLWTLLGVNNRRLHNLNKQLSLLNRVDEQRRQAIKQLVSLVHDLGDIQAKLGDLRDRVAAPELLADDATIPLQVHIQTINAGVERLEKARSRIRAEEDERLQRALNTPIGKEPLIEG